MSEPLTKAQRKALAWFSERPFASTFGADEPSLAMVRKLKAMGFVETAGADPGRFGFTRFAITKAGREA